MARILRQVGIHHLLVGDPDRPWFETALKSRSAAQSDASTGIGKQWGGATVQVSVKPVGPERKIKRAFPAQNPTPAMDHDAYNVHLRAQASPAYTLWTCWEIGGDILSDIPGREERRDILTNIMRALNWPKGSIAFAPLSSPAPGSFGLEPDLDLFRIYLKRTSPVYLFCFGTRGRDVLAGAPEFTAEPDQAFASKPLFVLPDLQEMISGDRKAKALAWQTLKRFSP